MKPIDRALKNKMQHKVSIEISFKPEEMEKEKERNSDLAPKVLDSDEPGVDKGDREEILERIPRSTNSIGPMTLHDRARAKMMKKKA